MEVRAAITRVDAVREMVKENQDAKSKLRHESVLMSAWKISFVGQVHELLISPHHDIICPPLAQASPPNGCPQDRPQAPSPLADPGTCTFPV